MAAVAGRRYTTNDGWHQAAIGIYEDADHGRRLIIHDMTSHRMIADLELTGEQALELAHKLIENPDTSTDDEAAAVSQAFVTLAANMVRKAQS